MKKIKTKILVNMCVCVLIASSVIGVLASYLNFRSTVATLQQALVESAEIAAEEVSSKLVGYQMLAEGIAQNKGLAAGSLAERRAELSRMQQSSWYLSLEILDEKGLALSGGGDYSSQESFTHARDKGTFFITDPVVQGKESRFYLSYPIQKNGVFGGAVVITLDGKILSDIVSLINIGEGGSAYVIAKDGTTIGSPFYDAVLQKQNTQKNAENDPSIQSLAPIEAAMCRGESGFAPYEYQGVQKLAAYCPIPGTDWSLDVAVTRSDFMAATNRSLMITMVMILVMCFLSYLIAHYSARTISTPIVACSERLRQLAEGDFMSPVPSFRTKDETTSLLESTGDLVEELKEVVFDISGTLDSMAAGDFTVRFEQNYKGDFRPIQASMNTILNSMNETLFNIELTSDQVSVGAEQVADVSQGLSQGTTQQASAVEQLSASVQGIANDVQSNADNAQQANEKASAVGTLLMESNRRMDDLTVAMDEIRSTAGQIGKIIKTIEDIAFQTNILALNAAVEAARAGAAGKGFAVVADEVRNLASKSAEASKSTSALIEGSLHAVTRGAELTGATAETLNQVVVGAREIIETVDRISAASNQQADSIRQISIGVEQITSVVQANSATAEESASASEELSGQAVSLKDMVRQFKLRSQTTELLSLK